MAVGQMFQARLDQYLTQVHKKWASPTVNVMNETVGYLKQKTGPLADRDAAILSSPRWNRYEKEDQRTALSREVEPHGEKLRKQLQAESEKLQRLKGMLNVVVPAPENETVRAIREMEYRSVLRAMPEPQRVQTYLRAAENGAVDTLHAFTTSPDALLSDALQREGLDIFHQKYSPETWAAHQQTEIIVEELSSLLEHVGLWVADLQSGQGLK